MTMTGPALPDPGKPKFSPDWTGPLPEREEEDDHDLLTYGEAGVRLKQEIALQRERVEAARAQGAEALAKAERRLDLLLDAVGRHAGNRIDADNFEKFFGYKGTPRRLTEER